MTLPNSPRYGPKVAVLMEDIRAHSVNEQLRRDNVVMVPHDGHIDCPRGHECGFWEGLPETALIDIIGEHMREHE